MFSNGKQGPKPQTEIVDRLAVVHEVVEQAGSVSVTQSVDSALHVHDLVTTLAAVDEERHDCLVGRLVAEQTFDGFKQPLLGDGGDIGNIVHLNLLRITKCCLAQVLKCSKRFPY